MPYKTPELEQEVRTFDFDSLELRAAKEGEPQKIVGHAGVFNKLSDDLGGFRELFKPGAFTDSIKRDDIRSLFNHTPSYILGRKKAGTLEVSEDDKGVYYEVTPPDTRYSHDLMVSIQRRDISQGSIIFRIDNKRDQQWFVDGEEADIADAFMAMWDGKKHKIERHVLKARLYDVGPVTFPAYPQTDVTLRSMLNGTGLDLESLRKQPDPDGALKTHGPSLEALRFRLK